MSVMASRRGTPVYELATLFPAKGYWSEDDYLSFDENILVEYDNGFIEVLPMPTTSHQAIVLFLLRTLLNFVEPQELGLALMAPLKLRVGKSKYREPDILFLLEQNRSKAGEQFWSCADLVIEVVSPDDPRRDHVQKRLDYARAGVSEYWIVDPQAKTVTVLKRVKGKYQPLGVFRRGENAQSALLEGFKVSVTRCFAAGGRN